MEIHFADKDQTCISVLCLKKDAEVVEEALRSIGFARPALGVSGLPSGEMERMEAAVREKHGRIGQLIKEIEDFAGIRKDLEITADYYRNRADKYQLLGKLPQSKNVYFISGYVPAKTSFPYLPADSPSVHLLSLPSNSAGFHGRAQSRHNMFCSRISF